MAHPHAHEIPDRHERAHAMIARTGHHLSRGGHADMREDAEMITKAIHEHEANDHPHQPKTKLKLKAGGAVHGEAASHHLGRRARGGPAGKKSTHVNVIVAPQGGGGMRPPMAMPAAAPPPRPAAPPPPAMAPRPPMAPPGAGMMPPGGGMRPPGMMKRGGGVKTVEAGTPSENLLQAQKGGAIKKRDVGGPTMPMTGAQPGGSPQLTPQQMQAAQQMMAQRQMGQGMPTQKRGGRTERKNGGGVHMEAGAGGGEGRIEKMHEYGEGGFKPKEHRGELVRARG